ncbi:hypothetical protein, partial [Prosthecobacter sp.]|uniref:hypothetical protein n=1 Tax=Prosthecobacter sp. TaxID=1965333 RepID=UPI0026279639
MKWVEASRADKGAWGSTREASPRLPPSLCPFFAKATKHLNSRRLDCGTEGNFSANDSEGESDEQRMESTEQKQGKMMKGKIISGTEP